jgi:glycosyltransferase involved in cell wall biosynthesis
MLDESALQYADAVGYSNKRDYLDCLLDRRITTAIYDHLFLDPDQVVRYGELLGKFVDGYYVSSNKLANIYRAKYPDAVPMLAVPDGVDLSLFRPMNLERFDNKDRPLVVGWVGNSMWSSEKEDFKGLHTIIKPALEQLRSEGLELDEIFADRAVAYTPLSQMPDYYARIDVLICASKIEGTPNPVLEAMACGVPVISTDVGIVPEAFGALQKSFILADRSIASMKEAIRRLYQDRVVLAELSHENLEAIVPWNWSRRVQEFRRFFDDVLARPPKWKNPP